VQQPLRETISVGFVIIIECPALLARRRVNNAAKTFILLSITRGCAQLPKAVLLHPACLPEGRGYGMPPLQGSVSE